MKTILKGCTFFFLLTALQGINANFIPTPNTENLFYHGVSSANTGVGLWVAPISLNQRPNETASPSTDNITQTVSSVLNSTGTSQLLNNLFNSGLLNQVGVGVKVNF